MKGLKFLAICVLMLLTISTVFGAVFPFPGQLPGTDKLKLNDFRIDSVEVNGVSATGSKIVYAERGSVVPVEVEFTGTGKVAYDTKLRVFVGGYEFGDVEQTSEIFQVLPGVTDRRVVRLELPYDLEASDEYTLNVELYDDDNSVRKTFKLRVEESRHSINIFDVVLNPTNNVQAGTPLFATVRVENLGDNIENTVKVTLSVPELNLQTSQIVDRLVTDQELNEDDSSSRRTAATTNDMVLFLPENTPEGDYNVVVKVDYNRLHNSQSKTYLMHVRASREVQVQPTGGLNINVDTGAQRVSQGQGAQYKFSVANLGQTPVTLTFEVLGVSDWGTYRVDPQTVNVQSNGMQDVNVFVAPYENFVGTKSFTVRVKQGNNVVAEKSLSVEVAKAVSDSDMLKKVLVVGFAVLLAVLVILGIALVVKRLSQDDEKPVEGQTYY